MTEQFQNNTNLNLKSGNRIMNISIIIPKIRSEFYVRLYTLLGSNPKISDEGFEFFIIDNKTGIEFSAGLTGFGPGYFSVDISDTAKQMVEDFHKRLFTEITEFKECKLEIENDFGKTILGFENGELIELDLEEDE